MLPLLSLSILYHQILPLSRPRKILQVHFKLRGTQDIMKRFISDPFKTGLIMCLIGLVLEGGHKSTKNGIAMGVKIGGDAAKSVKNTHLLVIMRVWPSQKTDLLDLTNWTQFKKGNGQKQRTKIKHDYYGMFFMLHTQYYYYTHKNIELLGV